MKDIPDSKTTLPAGFFIGCGMSELLLDLGDDTPKKIQEKDIPLASRFYPASLDSFLGQEHILGAGKLLRRAIESDRVGTAIFFGPPGTGKTALAKIISGRTRSFFVETNAVLIGVQDVRRIIETAELRKKTSGAKTTLLLDEIHHFNKTQQDALLPAVEKGTIVMIGVTTENPYFYINQALLSRATVFEFKPLGDTEIKRILLDALNDADKGLGTFKVEIAPDALNHIIKYSEGDVRKALSALEIGALTTPPSKEGKILFDLNIAEDSIQKKALLYDKSGDQHYDCISAFIKSMRGSDPDAAVYWLAKMLAAGEDPRFIARRIVIAASEDVGNADPGALNVAISALEAVEFVGMPEARIPLAQAAIYVATAPKSNASYVAIESAQQEVAEEKNRQVPDHLRDSHADGDKLGHGNDYKYPHDFKGHFVRQEYMPRPKKFYFPSDQGYETIIAGYLKKHEKDSEKENNKK